MAWTTLVDAEELARAIDRCVVVDCRFELARPDAGRAAYEAGHLPGAFFLDQDRDLAGARTGRNGRHPLPERAALLESLRALGVDDDTQVVAYDAGSAFFAARLWWLCRWLGHRDVAVLDGGLDAWRRAGYPLVAGATAAARRGTLADRPSLAPSVDTGELMAGLADSRRLIVDARTAERYRGEVEPLDPVAGHIPGARNRPNASNVRPDGRFKPAAVLREEFGRLLGARAPAEVVHHCGSGISACQSLLAMEVAGLPGSALYPGSWSEWCADPSRPVGRGED